MVILICVFNDFPDCSWQVSRETMYHPDFSRAKIIDTHPNFWMENGSGRIINYQWNQFLRKIKRYLRNNRIVRWYLLLEKSSVFQKLPKELKYEILNYR